jgi:ubiquinone/menaquinone biosynthesis C-methylase UbiE
VEQSVTRHAFSDGEAYEQFMGRWSREVGKAFLAWLQPPKGAHWLDVGCGTGILTQLISASCTPASVIAVDPAQSQIAHARNGVGQTKVEFRLADAQELPFPDASFDVVASSLVLNFVPNRARAMCEMRRVARPGGLIAACVWDFAAGLSPSGPLRRAIRRIGIAPPPIPGTDTSTLAALTDLFENGGLKGVTATAIEVTVSFPSFEDFWLSQTPHYAPITKLIDAMSWTDRKALKEAVHADLQALPAGIRYPARANAIKGHRQA